MKLYCLFDTNEKIYVGKPFVCPSDMEASMSFKADYDNILKSGVNPNYLQLRKIARFNPENLDEVISIIEPDAVALNFISDSDDDDREVRK